MIIKGVVLLDEQCLFYSLLYFWTSFPEAITNHLDYFHQHRNHSPNCNPTANQTSHYTIQYQYSHTSCNPEILRYEKHTHFSNAIGTANQYPIQKKIEFLCFTAYWITSYHPNCQQEYRKYNFKQYPFHSSHLHTYHAAPPAGNSDSSLKGHYKELLPYTT